MVSAKQRAVICVSVMFACCLVAGCGGREKVRYYVGRKNNNPVVSIGKLAIVLESVEFKGDDHPHAPNSYLLASHFIVPDQTSNVTQVTKDIGPKGASVDIAESFGGGVNTVKFESISKGTGTFKLVEKGTMVQFTNQLIPLNDGPQTIIVDKDGNVKEIIRKQ